MSRLSALKHGILRFCYAYALLLGISSLRYDWRWRCVRRSTLQQCYALGMNVALLLAAPFSVRVIYEHFSGHGNPLLWQQMLLTALFRSAAMLLTVLTRWSRDRQLLLLARQLQRSHPEAAKGSAQLRSHCERVFCCKFVTTASQSLTVLYNAWRYTPGTRDFWSALSTAYALNLHNTLNGSMLLYFGVLWCARERLGVLNEQLAALHARARDLVRWQALLPLAGGTLLQLQLAYAAEVWRLARAHLALHRFVRQLNAAFEQLISAVLLAYVVNNISMGYNAALYHQGALSNYAMAFASVTYCMLSLDLYLLYWACEATTGTYQRTAVLLQRFSELPPLTQELQQSLDTFSLQLTQHPLQIRMGGMYSLKKASAFVVLAETLLHTIILVQFDMSWRYRERGNVTVTTTI